MQPYNHDEIEKRIYQMWEEGGYFTPQIDLKKKPFVMVLVPPNASGAMHLGNIFSLVLQDILIRYHRMKGEPTLFLPGTDHGGYETQITYEQELNREGKRSSNLTRRELYKNISSYVQQNNELIRQQIKVLGASVDWSRFRFTLDERAVQIVYTTFKKLRQDGLIERDRYSMDYCPECKTTLQNIEIENRDGVRVCKAGHSVEKRDVPNWRLRVDALHKSLKRPVVNAVLTAQIAILPLSKDEALKCMEDIQDWYIARQNVWGIRIPGWYEVTDPTLFTVWFIDSNGSQQNGNLKELLESGFSWEEIEEGLERIQASENATYVLEEEEKKIGVRYLPETDTFDTWFSSSQWPVTAFEESSVDFSYFYPTSSEILGRDLLQLVVTREIMFACYLTGKFPYSSVYLHRMVLGIDKNHKKMSKSMGNAVYPEDYVKNFGADALRMALVSYLGQNRDFLFPEEKTVAYYQRFALGIWELGQRIVQMVNEERTKSRGVVWYSRKLHQRLHKEDNEILELLNNLIADVTNDLENFRLTHALQKMKKFFFEQLKTSYMSYVRQRYDREIGISVLRYVYLTYIALLHPFVPFMTEEVYGILVGTEKLPLIITSWPQLSPRASG